MLSTLKLKTLSKLPNTLVLATIGLLYYVYMESFLTPLLITQNNLETVGFSEASSWAIYQKISFKKSTVYFCVLHFLLFWFVLSYLRVVYTSPGHVPTEWNAAIDKKYKQKYAEHIAGSGRQGIFSKLNLKTAIDKADFLDQKFTDFLDKQGAAYCVYCMQFKPERAHHCSQAGQCVLKLDHYCNWVVNCVGFKNYKFFLVFILYTSRCC
jgi:hypothetical protein